MDFATINDPDEQSLNDNRTKGQLRYEANFNIKSHKKKVFLQ